MQTENSNFVLSPGNITLRQLRNIARSDAGVDLDPAFRDKVNTCRRFVDEIVERGDVVYGVNTGFGKFARKRIAADRLHDLQRNLVLSHSAGVGALLPNQTVHLIMALKVIGLAQGFSGIRYETIDAILKLLNAGVYPCVPSKGSVGASGDLAPLAHLAGPLIGIGQVNVDGAIMPAKKGLEYAGLKPLELGPREAVALLNGTEVSTAFALLALFEAEDILAAAICAGALSVEAAMASHRPFDERFQQVRGHEGQMAVAGIYRRILADSEINRSHADCEKVQDPYSLRCQPQVMGACLDNLRFVARTLKVESNGVADSPLFFADTGEVVSGGNFHGEPVGLAADVLALVLAEVGAMSERRTALLLDSNMSGLPDFLVREGGLNSGLMMAQVTAASLASENKSLAHPATVDSLPTSANQEDHVPMSTFAARRLLEMSENSATIIAIELIAAAQGIEFHRPLRSSDQLERVIAAIRDVVRPYDQDRLLAPDIEGITKLVQTSTFYEQAADILPSGCD